MIRLLTRLKPHTKTGWFILAGLSIAPLLPLSNFVGYPQWDHIRWIPFQDFSFSRNMLKDVVGNTLWFTMFGYLLHHQLNDGSGSASPRALVTIVLMACGVSLSAEFFQIFCRNRTPSITDVICNMVGAALGDYWAMKPRAARATDPWLTTWLAKLTILSRSNESPVLYRQRFPRE